MKSHPMFRRSTIHLGLVGEVRMHNGKNNPHYWMEENGKGEQRTQGTANSCLREVCGGGAPSLLPAEKSLGSGKRWLADQNTSERSSGSWQLVASPLSPPLAGFLLRVTGQATPLREMLSVDPGPGAGQPLAVLPSGPAEEETATQAGPDWARPGCGDEGRRRSQVRDPGAS